MDSVEAAIRKAFEKGDTTDPEFRNKVYRSALAAFERQLAGRADTDSPAVERRREAVKATIMRIEKDQRAAAAALRTPTPAPRPLMSRPEARPQASRPVLPIARPYRSEWRPEPEAQPEPEAPIAAAAPRAARPGRFEPAFESLPEPRAAAAARRERAWSQPAARRRAEPELEAFEPVIESERAYAPEHVHEPALDDEYAAPRPARRRAPIEPPRKRRSLLRRMAIPLVALAVLGLGAVYLMSILAVPGEDVAASTPPQQVAADAQATLPPAVSVASDGDWVVLFNPGDASGVNAQPGVEANLTEEEGRSFLRVSSSSPSAQVRFAIGQGTLERLAGQGAVFSLVTRARPDDGETQFSVDCDFAGLGDCGRRRFGPRQVIEEFIFEVPIPEGNPTGAGMIAISPDVTGAGRALDILEIRVAPAA